MKILIGMLTIAILLASSAFPVQANDTIRLTYAELLEQINLWRLAWTQVREQAREEIESRETLIAKMEDKDIAWASAYRSRVKIIPVIFITQDIFRTNVNADTLTIGRTLGITKAWFLKETGGATFDFKSPIVIRGEKKSEEYEAYAPREQAQIIFSELEIKIPRESQFEYYLVFMAGKKSLSWGENYKIAVVNERNFDALRSDLGWSSQDRAIAIGLITHELGHIFGLRHSEDMASVMGVKNNKYASDMFPGVGLTPGEKGVIERLVK